MIPENRTALNSPDSPDEQGNFIVSLAHNFRVAWFAIVQRREAPNKFEASLGQLIVLCLFIWVLSATDDFLTVGADSSLSIWGVVGDAALNYFWLVALAVATLLLGSLHYFLMLAVGTAAVSVVVSTIWIPAGLLWAHNSPSSFQSYSLHASWLLFALEIFAFFRIVTWYCGIALTHRYALTVVYGGIVFLSIWYLPPQSLFYTPWESQIDHEINVEDTYYSQRNMMKQALYEVSEETEGRVDIYSIGVAAFGAQDVFYREVTSALSILEGQFNNDDKSLALINNPSTVNTAPIANLHNLRGAVEEIAQKMNLDEDILLLFLSSHGSEDGHISVELGDFQLNDISAHDVRSLLDEANIYWRVIIVSACYSGSFIDALQSPTTLILTAAAADKASFGCENTRDWTYFGEAFFSQALPVHETFVASFNAAREVLKQREVEEGKEPSNPQLWLGEAMKAYLTLHAL